MGYALAMGHCVNCGQTFTFNPIRVPSLRIAGERMPVCRSCADAINELRAKNGLEGWTIAEDAYEEVDEGELH